MDNNVKEYLLDSSSSGLGGTVVGSAAQQPASHVARELKGEGGRWEMNDMYLIVYKSGTTRTATLGK